MHEIIWRTHNLLQFVKYILCKKENENTNAEKEGPACHWNSGKILNCQTNYGSTLPENEKRSTVLRGEHI